jgi:hypothetical protein
MRDSFVVTVSDDNITSFVHDDEMAAMLNGHGESLTVRATHCEPQANGNWAIDLGPSGGPVVFGFESKRDALFAEVQWLEQNVL